MITTADLKTQTRRDLAGTARDIGIAGWHSMKKDELIEAIRSVHDSARGAAEHPTAAASDAKPAATSPNKPPSGKAKASSTEGNAGESGAVKRRRPVATKQPAGKSTESSAKPETSPQSSDKTTPSKPAKPTRKGSDTKQASGTENEAEKKSISKKPAKSVPVASKPEAIVPAGGGSKSKRPVATPRKPTSPEILKVLRKQQASAESKKDLSACVVVNGSTSGNSDRPSLKERIVLIVRDSYWLQASWVITRASVERARAAMGADWHTAEPVLRLLEVAHGASANTAEQVVRDIPIHGGVNNWYIDVEHPPSRYRVVIGYRSASTRFFTLFRSNIVLTPEPGACDPIDGHWQDIAEDYERIYSLSDNDSGTGSNDLREMFEERLQRPMIDFKGDLTGLDPDLSFRREKDLPFEVDAELIVYGSTSPGASITLAGAPVRLRPDGTFTVRMELPDRRQVIPVVACSRDGMRQRTTVVAVERNTKVMEPVSKNHMD